MAAVVLLVNIAQVHAVGTSTSSSPDAVYVLIIGIVLNKLYIIATLEFF
jgi:hypothetical protein